MTKVTCDVCGCALSTGTDANKTNVTMLFYGPTFDSKNDFCISCGTQIYNHIESFIAWARDQEAIRNENA